MNKLHESIYLTDYILSMMNIVNPINSAAAANSSTSLENTNNITNNNNTNNASDDKVKRKRSMSTGNSRGKHKAFKGSSAPIIF
jgi:hypothetical protein